MNKKIPQEILDELDQIAALVAGLIQLDQDTMKIGEPPDESRKALLKLGEAYMYLYNLLLDNYNYKEQDEEGSD